MPILHTCQCKPMPLVTNAEVLSIGWTPTLSSSSPVISRCMELSMGSGRDRKLKGSKRALMWPHVLHFTWDLSCPWNRSTTMDRFLRRWFSHAFDKSKNNN